MSIELILAIVSLVGTLVFGLTSARKARVDTIVGILDELEEQYKKLKDKYETLEETHKALQAAYNTLKESYEKLRLDYERLLEENRELRAILRKSGIDCPYHENGNNASLINGIENL